MDIELQITIVTELIEATEELNGEYQEGWDETIKNAKDLLIALKQVENTVDLGDISGSLPVKCKTIGIDGELNHTEMSAMFAGEYITKMSEKEKLTEDFIKEYNDH
jgi:hypothetical protein